MTHPVEATYLGHHALLLAIPALVPAVVVAGVVVYIAVRDRRSPADTAEEDGRAEPR
ncbi:hypothetical protein BH09ACT7_BH09ACT7_58790 [soil metagenome]